MVGQAKRRVCDRSLRDSEIIDIVYADNFSDIPSDCELGLSDVESDSGSEVDYDISRKRKRTRVLDISSDSESDSDNCSPTRVEITRPHLTTNIQQTKNEKTNVVINIIVATS